LTVKVILAIFMRASAQHDSVLAKLLWELHGIAVVRAAVTDLAMHFGSILTT